MNTIGTNFIKSQSQNSDKLAGKNNLLHKKELLLESGPGSGL